MQCVLFAGLLCMIGVVGVQSHPEMNSDNKSELSSLTSSSKISNSLRDLLNQESLIRFSMTQKIQGLVMDALDNKNNSLTLKKKLRYITTELQSIEAKDQVMKEENAQLKQELNTVKEAINSDKNLIMQQIQSLIKTGISVLAEKMEDENSKFRQELMILNETNQRVQEENSKLRLQFQMINGSLQQHDLQLLNISTQLSSGTLSLNSPHGSCMGILQSDPDVKGKDGVYSIYVGYHIRKVYCDMTTDGGG
ncbi:uncharacterized protein LOC125657113 [Ostrea edulis]|uniref:uncharacterized protein LOC125657113 n=1 Tax=Ostrea edulis TaxID=37623 RepID=UPI0024AFAE1A|nr:uncharacterized protein LOC125657113 [Ostrea edulis]